MKLVQAIIKRLNTLQAVLVVRQQINLDQNF